MLIKPYFRKIRKFTKLLFLVTNFDLEKKKHCFGPCQKLIYLGNTFTVPEQSFFSSISQLVPRKRNFVKFQIFRKIWFYNNCINIKMNSSMTLSQVVDSKNINDKFRWNAIKHNAHISWMFQYSFTFLRINSSSQISLLSVSCIDTMATWRTMIANVHSKYVFFVAKTSIQA